MDLRTELMKRLLAGERMTDLCRKYGISRKTGHKFKKRFERFGMTGLADESRAPKVIPHKTPPELEELIVAERKEHPTWGPKKLKASLEQRLERRFPSAATIGTILKRHGLVQKRKRRPPHRSTPTTLREATAPNDVWCIDYKGQFRLGDGTYCYPLTMTDQFSRQILGCEGMGAISVAATRDVCEVVFREHGLPAAIRSDNGAPFASTGFAGLTLLSVFWLKLGIQHERIRPAHPEENGRHERMHRTLKFETARPARENLLQQQERFDEFVDEFNHRRPHEALGMKRPVDVFEPSSRPFPDQIPEPSYRAYDDVLRVSRLGQIYIAGLGQLHLTTALAGEYVGIRELRDGRWLVNFAGLDLGYALPDRTMTPMISSPLEAH